VSNKLLIKLLASVIYGDLGYVSMNEVKLVKALLLVEISKLPMYDYCEIDPVAMFSISGAIIPQANRQAVDRDLPALLTSVASSVRAGVDPVSALLAAQDYFQKETPIVREIKALQRGFVNGGDEEELLEGFLAIYPTQEGELFRRCLILSRRHGSSLGDPLHRITRVVRQRQSFRRKVRAALAMHRMSAIGIALCAVAMGALQLGMNPRALDVAMNHPTGGVLLLAGVSLISLGVVWMMLMGREAATR
jgi:Flp pilus assembly protein TadB